MSVIAQLGNQVLTLVFEAEQRGEITEEEGIAVLASALGFKAGDNPQLLARALEHAMMAARGDFFTGEQT